MPVGGWNGGHWSPNLDKGPSGYEGPGRTPPFREWGHLSVDEQIQQAKDWRAQHSTRPAPVSTLSSTPARSSPPHALPPRPPRSGSSGPVTAAPERPYPDHQPPPQRELTFGGHRTPRQPSATQQPGNGQPFSRQAPAHRQSATTPAPRPDPAVTAETDALAPVAVAVAAAAHPAAVPHQGPLERESSFEEDYKRWESQVVYGQTPVPTSHILVPRVPAPGPPTTPFYVSSPPAPTRSDSHSIASQNPISRPPSSIPLGALEGFTAQPQSRRALPEAPSSVTAHPVPGAVQAPITEGNPSSLDAPIATDRLSDLGETGTAIEWTPDQPEENEPRSSRTGYGAASDDSGLHRAIRNVEAHIEGLEFQPLTAPVKEPPPRRSDTEAVNKKTAKNRAGEAKQKERRKLASKAAAATEEPEYDTESDTMKDDGKRKAVEDPASPAAAKRVKHDDSAEPPPKPKMAVIPFPEKVCANLSMVESMLTFGPACSARGTCR